MLLGLTLLKIDLAILASPLCRGELLAFILVRFRRVLFEFGVLFVLLFRFAELLGLLFVSLMFGILLLVFGSPPLLALLFVLGCVALSIFGMLLFVFGRPLLFGRLLVLLFGGYILLLLLSLYISLFIYGLRCGCGMLFGRVCLIVILLAGETFGVELWLEDIIVLSMLM
jgi:hypothetical protein